jgi:hypothetical protein
MNQGGALGGQAGVSRTNPPMNGATSDQSHRQEEKLLHKYGNLPNRRDILQRRLRANHLHERKFYDSADATLAKAGRESVDQVGEFHPYVPPGLTPLTRRGLNGTCSADQNSGGSSADEGSDSVHGRPRPDATASLAGTDEIGSNGDRTRLPSFGAEIQREGSMASSGSSIGSAAGFVPLRRSAEVQRSELPPVAEPDSVVLGVPERQNEENIGD